MRLDLYVLCNEAMMPYSTQFVTLAYLCKPTLGQWTPLLRLEQIDCCQ